MNNFWILFVLAIILLGLAYKRITDISKNFSVLIEVELKKDGVEPKTVGDRKVISDKL